MIAVKTFIHSKMPAVHLRNWDQYNLDKSIINLIMKNKNDAEMINWVFLPKFLTQLYLMHLKYGSVELKLFGRFFACIDVISHPGLSFFNMSSKSLCLFRTHIKSENPSFTTVLIIARKVKHFWISFPFDLSKYLFCMKGILLDS